METQTQQNPMSICEHKYVFRGLHIEGSETRSSSFPYKTLYEVYFCEKCTETKRNKIECGYHIQTPAGASTSGYGFR